jgi:murein DD-endopeptidase MepM/ murein hydrolase activator NlpD
MGQIKYYNLLIVPEGVENPFGIRVKAWVLRAVIALAAVLFITLILFFIFYGRIMMRVSQADRLEKENESLRLYKYKLLLLEQNMKEARAVVDRIALLAGIDFQIPELPSDSELMATLEESGLTGETLDDAAANVKPYGLPMKGFMTRGYSDDPESQHPGIDIAAAIGTPVTATAAGKVVFAGNDSTYGLTVIIEHADNISTLFGHNSELLVGVGSVVAAGQKIALSGNTGKSTAPHLHYEIRENGKPVNPLRYIDNHEISNK